MLPGGEYIIFIYITGQISLQKLEIGFQLTEIAGFDDRDEHLVDGSDEINSAEILYGVELGTLLVVTVDREQSGIDWGI